MNYYKPKRLCDNLVISEAVTFADGNLTINLPARTYNNQCKYCLVIAQTIPVTTTVVAPVVITIGDGTETYPLVNCDGTPVLACSVNTRTKYCTIVNTTTTSGVFKLLGKLPCSRCESNLTSLPVAETTTGG